MKFLRAPRMECTCGAWRYYGVSLGYLRNLEVGYRHYCYHNTWDRPQQCAQVEVLNQRHCARCEFA